VKVLFVGVFTDNNKSTNDSQARAFEANGCEVVRYNYRIMKDMLGFEERDHHIAHTCKHENIDLVVFSKCNGVNVQVIHECNKLAKTCLWFMDAFIPNHWSPELIQKIEASTFVCCDKSQSTSAALHHNPNTYQVYEGFDDLIDKPHNLVRDIPVSFIGDPYGERRAMCDVTGAMVFQNTYGEEHAKIVSRSQINLNLCTGNCASDRVYKILGAGGLLFTDDWEGRKESFESGKDLIIFNSGTDLAYNIDKYLNDDTAAQIIRDHGFNTVQKYSRIEWAKGIINILENNND